jgi:hypothetical protein
MKMSFKTALSLIPILSLGGCATTHYIPAALPASSLGSNEKVIGVASGIGETLEEAKSNAIRNSGADTLRDVYADTEWSCVGSRCAPTGRIRVLGALVRYENPSAVSGKDEESLERPANMITGNINKETLEHMTIGSKIAVTLKSGRVLGGLFEGISAQGKDWFWIKEPDEFTELQIDFQGVQSIELK